MSKKRKTNIEKQILSQIKLGEISMKPKWHFVVASTLLFISLLGLSLGVIFLVNLSIFILERNGPHIMNGRLEYVIASFPWWVPALAIIGIFVAIWLLKKYDFSYKKNFMLIIVLFVLSILVAGLLLDKLGVNSNLSRGHMRRFYQRHEIDDMYDLYRRGVVNNERIYRRH